ncbi:MAG: cytochrome c oxidase subunit II [Bdellovibrionales bacterium]
MPPQISTFAADFDNLYAFLIWSSLISAVLMIGGMLYFVFKYSRKTPNDKTAYISHNAILEFLWSFIPLVLFMAVFVWGWIVYYKQRNPPPDSMEIHVTARQWLWEFEYKNGKKTTNEIYAPVGVPVKLVMTSADVIHSFYVPSFRQKQDVVPGMYTQTWFQAEQKGVYQVFCTEFCGTNHSSMLAKVHVVDKSDFDVWMGADPNAGKSLAERGADLYKVKGCNACHTVDGAKSIGPTFKGLWARSEELADGSKITVDENYVRESILTPQAKLVKGYPPTMPSFQGVLNDEEIKAMIEFMKTVK